MKDLLDPSIEAYAQAHSIPESDVCRRLRKETFQSMECPQMIVGPLEGAFLKMMAQMVSAKRILEIGTFTGFSAQMMASALPEDGELITCDIEESTSKIAKEFFVKTKLENKIIQKNTKIRSLFTGY